MQAPVPFSATNTAALANFRVKIHFWCTENIRKATFLNHSLSSFLGVPAYRRTDSISWAY